jgi:acyl-CoA thioesterase-1
MIWLALALALQTAPTPPAPDGVVENPCPASLALPAEFVAYRDALYSRTGAKAAMPSAEILAGYRAAQAERTKTDWASLCRYREANAKLAGTPQADRRIVFMGDSITEGWQYATPEFFTKGVIDRGISGQTTPQMLVRFSADVLALKPRAVHIMAGSTISRAIPGRARWRTCRAISPRW